MLARLIFVSLLLLAGAAQAQIPACLTRGGPFHIYQEEQPEERLITVVRRVRFTSVHRLPVAEQPRIARSFLGRRYKGPDWLQSLGEKARWDWQVRGYFKADIQTKYRVLSARGNRQQVAVTFSVEEGPQYRLGTLSFKNAKVFDPHQLEGAVPLKPGEIFNTDKVRQGLEALRYLYAARGYINFTSVPDTQVDEATQTIALTIDLDEGEQFVVGEVEVLGLDPATTAKLHQELKLESGQPFNARSLKVFWMRHRASFPPHSSLEENSQRRLDVRRHAVDLTLDFRPPLPPRDDTEVCEMLGIDPRLYRNTSKNPH